MGEGEKRFVVGAHAVCVWCGIRTAPENLCPSCEDSLSDLREKALSSSEQREILKRLQPRRERDGVPHEEHVVDAWLPTLRWTLVMVGMAWGYKKFHDISVHELATKYATITNKPPPNVPEWLPWVSGLVVGALLGWLAVLAIPLMLTAAVWMLGALGWMLLGIGLGVSRTVGLFRKDIRERMEARMEVWSRHVAWMLQSIAGRAHWKRTRLPAETQRVRREGIYAPRDVTVNEVEEQLEGHVVQVTEPVELGHDLSGWLVAVLGTARGTTLRDARVGTCVVESTTGDRMEVRGGIGEVTVDEHVWKHASAKLMGEALPAEWAVLRDESLHDAMEERLRGGVVEALVLGNKTRVRLAGGERLEVSDEREMALWQGTIEKPLRIEIVSTG